MPDDPNAKKPEKRNWFPLLLGTFQVIVGSLIVYLGITLWPPSEATANIHSVRLFLWNVAVSYDQHIVFFAMLSGAAGSFVHSSTSFVGYAGNQCLKISWVWWYLLRPLMGAILAFGFYLVIRGGLVTVESGPNSLNVYGIAAVGFMSGMFSKQAIDKLEEVFNTLFHLKEEAGDSARRDKMDEPSKT